MCVYIYIYIYRSPSRAHAPRARAGERTANLSTKTLDFRGSDSSIVLIVRGGILRSTGNSSESLSQAILVGIILVGRLGIPACATAAARRLRLHVLMSDPSNDDQTRSRRQACYPFI